MLKSIRTRMLHGTALLAATLVFSAPIAPSQAQETGSVPDVAVSAPLPPDAALSADVQAPVQAPTAAQATPHSAPPAELPVIVELPPEAPLHLGPEPTTTVAAPAQPTEDKQAAEKPAQEQQPQPQQAQTPPQVDQQANEQAKDLASNLANELALRERIRQAAAALVEAEPARTAKAQRREREAVAAFYAARDNAPLWTDGKALTKAGASLVARLDRANEDGLDLVDFRGVPTIANDDQAAATELALTTAAVTYALQARGARIDPRTIGLITAKPEIPDVATILATLASAGVQDGRDVGEQLAAFNPPQPGYRALRAKLAELRREHPAIASQRIGPGPVLRVGMKDQRVPLLRARLGVDAESETDPMLYDVRVASAVADFNRANGLPAVNTLTSRTIAKLSGGEPLRLEAELLSNMEFWRWMPRDMGETRIEVNIPDYQVKVTRGSEVIHTARVVVGKPQTPTPVFSHAMQHLIVNPYWNVPVSIIKKEMMPGYAKDPSYFQRRGYEVTQTRGGQLVVRQPPGERNALGRIKFMFPNEHAVYLHDTPSRGLFANARRAYSHGCVRVDQPFRLAEVVLGKENGWSEQKVRAMVGGNERLVNLPQQIPIHIEYFTAFVDEDGKVQLREDIYGYSRKVQTALGL
ncbi:MULTISPECIES: L,D-transpeptidase family protein [unclassified Beijerinckia]|uniref:L,D-transpeptidase family protein n=1 Tax=unclassified Beijerinckia TaxID=2638183 RepID=UPI000895E1C3|nr:MULTISPECIES: L,D-transpeptidase family protein [unclassified Beijerinckia]MDH7798516.1 murein L,D-transpeptidase YcbB/YkuD [Beijerinckia sp. GAS462]SED23493.1 Murein L,D-transpeptidase YcbB/YkuD [Beijerinckia sp. 28-YEA-48]